MKLKDSVHQSFWAWRATRCVNVYWNYLINALHQGALAQHVGDHARELDVFCAAAVHAWMCEV